MDKKKIALIISTIAAISAALATLCVVITKKKRDA
jgi:Na+-translocating ferredoxin:NAD+ oxidoreductase RnfG subunit